MLVVGKITHKQAPHLQNLWAQFAYPSKCLHFSGCSNALENYSVVENLSSLIKVDYTVDTCEIDGSVMEKALKIATKRNE